MDKSKLTLIIKNKARELGFSFCASRGPIVAGNIIAKQKAFKFAKSFMSKYLLDYE